MPTYQDSSELLPLVKQAFERGITKLKAKGIAYTVTETFREYNVQVAYVLQGRAELAIVNRAREVAGLRPITEETNKNKITQTLDSYHIKRRAFDIVPVIGGKAAYNAPKETWLAIAECFKSEGFTWGGDWGKTAAQLGWDCPHFEMR